MKICSNPLTPREEKQIINLYKAGYGTSMIGTFMRKRTFQVAKLIKQHGLMRRREDTYNCCKHVNQFNKEATREKMQAIINATV